MLDLTDKICKNTLYIKNLTIRNRKITVLPINEY